MDNQFLRLLFYIFFSILIGVITGALDFIFSIGLDYASEFRILFFPYPLFFLPFIGLLICYLYKKYGKNSSKGMGLVFHSITEKDDLLPKRLIPFVVISTWLTHLFGGSAGREGVAVQIGATASNTIFSFIKKHSSIDIIEIKPILISCGIAAGFSGLFGTPIAATLFSIEVLKIGILEYKALFPVLISSYTAFLMSNYLGIKHFHFIIKNIPEFNVRNTSIIILSSLIFGFVGYLFSYLLNKIKTLHFFTKINPLKKIFIGSIILALMLFIFHSGRYSGLGTNLIENSFYGKSIYSYDWISKILFTVLTLGIGFQGGEVTPLFAIGASLGVVLGRIFDFPIEFLAALGYCCVFASATNTFLASVFIGLEIFGYNMTPYFFISCAIAFIFSGDLSIYSTQKKNHNKF